MKLVVALAFVLAGVFVVTECESPPEVPFPYADCYNALRDCVGPVYNNPLVARIQQDKDVLLENLEEACELYETTANCLRPHADSCDSELQRQIQVVLSLGDFVCSEEGRTLIHEFESSVCNTDEEKTDELQALQETCAREGTIEALTSDSPPDSCEITRGILSCISDRTTELCGDAAAEIVRRVFGAVIAIYTNDQCNLQAVRELLRRNLALVKKATKKRESDNALEWLLQRRDELFRRSE